MSDGVKREIAKVKLNEGALDDEPEKVWVRLSDGRLADDLIEPRPLWVFQGAFEREIFTGGSDGLRRAAAELIRRRRTQK